MLGWVSILTSPLPGATTSQDMAVVVTNSSGVQYLYEKGNISYYKTVMSECDKK